MDQCGGRRRRKSAVPFAEGLPTPAEIAAAAEFAARDAADFAAEWATLDAAEQERIDLPVVDPERRRIHPDDDSTPVDEAARARRSESAWLRWVADGHDVTVNELLAIAGAEPGTLGLPDSSISPGDSLQQLRAIDRLQAYLDSRRLAVIGHLCPADPDRNYRAEDHLVAEIQLARRVGPGVARREIDTARLLGGPFATAARDLEAGAISADHVKALVGETAHVTGDEAPHPDLGEAPVTSAPLRSREDKLAEIQARVAPLARRQTPSEFRDTVRAAICAVDPVGEADRRAAAKATRDVSLFTDRDGMGTLVGRDDLTSVRAISQELSRQARLLQRERGGARAARTDPDARIGACRADVLKALVLGTARTHAGTSDGDRGGTETREPVRPSYEGQLVIDLATLRGLADHPCLFDGAPIPAGMGRELAREVTAWRRLVAAPVTGHLLDYGTRVYLPQALQTFTKARDGMCTAPYCQRRASRCQMDHRIPFPDGPSSAANCGQLCGRHHPLKTERYAWVTDGRADGSMTWNTTWGQTVRTEPRSVLPMHDGRCRAPLDGPRTWGADPPGADTGDTHDTDDDPVPF